MVSIRIVFIGGGGEGCLDLYLVQKAQDPNTPRPPLQKSQDKKQLSIHTSVRLAF